MKRTALRGLALPICLVSVCLVSLAGCQGIARSTERPSALIGTPLPALRPPSASPTPLKCSPHPAGLGLQMALAGKSYTFQNIRLDGQGFVAGEKLYLTIETVGSQRSQRLEIFDLTVKADGTFSDSESLQVDAPNMRWQAAVVHQRGVACANLVMP